MFAFSRYKHWHKPTSKVGLFLFNFDGMPFLLTSVPDMGNSSTWTQSSALTTKAHLLLVLITTQNIMPKSIHNRLSYAV